MNIEQFDKAYEKLLVEEMDSGTMLKLGRIGRTSGMPISQFEFDSVIENHSGLDVAGEYGQYDELTGLPLNNPDENIVYIVGECNQLGYIDFGCAGWILISNVPKDICFYLTVKLTAEILPIYYNG